MSLLNGFIRGALQTASLLSKIWAWLPLAGEKQNESLPATTFNDLQHERFIMVTQQTLKDNFYYHEDGKFFRKIVKSNFIKVGDLAGNMGNKGYWICSIEGKQYLLHRLIFLYHYGYLPEQVDHIDGNKANNKILNLRACTNAENARNQGKRARNKTGFKGVFVNRHGKFVAQICLNYKRIHLGTFDTAEKAHSKYCEKAKELHGEFARGKS